MLLPLHAQAAEVTLPSGLTAGELAEQLSEENHPQKKENDDQYASAAVAVFQGDKILFEHYYGYTDVMQEIPADAESVYEWGSITKTLIWVSVMQLYEQGRIELDRDVRDYLPEGFFQHLSYDDPITMYHLMNHNAGWQESVHLAWT
ncbi:MAG: serine hydrolase, partial [Oscillospiraceae bacterium]|nr:serine hydrolase [Oscillospiraceae bacterium]